MTLTMIFWICFVKAIVMTVLYKLGVFRDPETVGRDKYQEQQVLKEYRDWKRKSPASADDLSERLKARSLAAEQVQKDASPARSTNPTRP